QWPADAPAEALSRLVRLLYGAHLMMMLLWTQERREETPATHGVLGMARDLLTLLGPGLAGPDLQLFFSQLDPLAGELLQHDPPPAVLTRAEAVLRTLFTSRRLLQPHDVCPQCYALHLSRVAHHILREQPVHMVLPAFP